MKILFHLGHPAHFHLFKNTISDLKNNGHKVFILIKKKDVLEDLLKSSGFDYFNILPDGRKDSMLSMIVGVLKQDARMFSFCLKNKPDILVGSSFAIAHIGFLLRTPSINATEDDADIVPFFSKITYPFTTDVLVPENTRMDKWKKKSTFYKSYHELAYLHPKNFTPNKEIVKKYLDADNSRFFIIRFAKLTAHHDYGIGGINNKIALQIINILKSHGNVFITSERELDENLEPYRIKISPKDMHDVMSSADLFIGDSQTMAAEAAVLGVPFIRFNDFVGKITYLEELENKYNLGVGIKTDETERLIETVESLISTENLKEIYQKRKEKMLEEKINYAKFLTWYIEDFPNSKKVMKENYNFQNKFA